MAAPKTTVWDLEPHTRAKHEILKRYLQAWIPIIHKKYGHAFYFDGFAGPGRYSRGEDGSPVIALKCALEQRKRITGKFTFRFIEKDADRAHRLTEIIGTMDLPDNFDARVVPEDYLDYMERLLEHFRTRPGGPPLAFGLFFFTLNGATCGGDSHSQWPFIFHVFPSTKKGWRTMWT